MWPNYELSTIYSDAFFFSPEKASLLTSSIFALRLKTPQHCFMIIKTHTHTHTHTHKTVQSFCHEM